MPLTLPHTVFLSKPFQFGKEGPFRESVTFERELTGGDMVYALNAGNKQGDMALRLLERATGISEPELRLLPLGDFMRLQSVVSDFLPDGLPIG